MQRISYIFEKVIVTFFKLFVISDKMLIFLFIMFIFGEISGSIVNNKFHTSIGTVHIFLKLGIVFPYTDR